MVDYSKLTDQGIENLITEITHKEYGSLMTLIKKELYKELNRRGKAKQDKTRLKFLLCILGIAITFAIILMIQILAVDKTNASGEFKSIKSILNLDGCRTIEKEDDHINRGHMYAMDIACIRGKGFTVTSPLFKDKYVVRQVGYDSKLGNFIVLKHGEYQFVYGHTKSKLKKGDRVIGGNVIGVVDKSGISENYHLHFELWKHDYNISYKAMLGEEVTYNTEYTYKLRKQRGWYLGEEEAMNFIADFEGYRDCAYPDGKQYSIGYGTKAKSKTECITKSEAKKRKLSEVSRLMEIVYKNHRVDYHNQRQALVSAMYNLGVNSSITKVTQRKTEKGIMQYFKKFNKAGGVTLRGLDNRRTLEGNLYLNKL